VGDFAYVGGIARSLDRGQQMNLHKAQIFLGTALNLLSSSDEEVEHVNISVGLPIDFYKEQNSRLSKTLTGLRIETEVHSKTKVFVIDRVAVYQQGVGAFVSLFLNPDGTPKDNKTADMDLYKFGGGIIDIGYNTSDYARIVVNSGMRVLADDLSGSLEGYGAAYVYENVADMINRDFKHDASPVDYENILKHQKGILYLKGNQIDITSYFEKGYQMLANKISSKISREIWLDTTDFASIYLTGGTASRIINYMDINGTKINLQEDSIYANCRGYMARTRAEMNKLSAKSNKEAVMK